MIGTLRGFGFKQWFLLILNTVLVAATIASAVGLSVVSNTLGSVRRADAFRGESDMRFAQIACFLPVGKGKEESDILSFRQTLGYQAYGTVSGGTGERQPLYRRVQH